MDINNMKSQIVQHTENYKGHTIVIYKLIKGGSLVAEVDGKEINDGNTFAGKLYACKEYIDNLTGHKKTNASIIGQRFYGLHFCEGVAEYENPNGGGSSRVFISNDVAKEMDTTFSGRPVFVHHVDEVNPSELANSADGVVVKSFYNPRDGKHWVEFMVTTDRGMEALSKRWKLSNAYTIKESKGGGKWHNVDYQQEVARGEYDHLAIVPNPRYEESMVLTPEEFKAYNDSKDTELKSLANSQDRPQPSEGKSMLNFFKRSKVDNAAEIEAHEITLSNGVSKSIKQLVNEAEEVLKKDAAEAKEAPLANGDHKVKVGEEEMTVNELVEKYSEMKKSAISHEEALKKAKELEAHEAESVAEEGKEEGKEVEVEIKSEADKALVEKKANELKKFEELKNAHLAAPTVKTIEVALDQVKRGQSRYGSGK